MRSSFGEKLDQLLDKDKDKDKPKDTPREASPTPVAPPSSKDKLSRSELGWLQSLVGKKKKFRDSMTWGEASDTLLSLMKDKSVVGMINKTITNHMPRTPNPPNKEKKVSLVLGIINGSALS